MKAKKKYLYLNDKDRFLNENGLFIGLCPEIDILSTGP